MIKTLNTLDKGGSVLDLTNASSDYALAVGETATITYTSATSVPLHVAVSDGLYNIIISGDTGTSVENDNNVAFGPNNTTYSSQFHIVGWKSSTAGTNATLADLSQNTFLVAWANIISANILISTAIKSKSINFTAQNKRVASTFEHFTASGTWNDTTTPWTSLGTITFPFAQSGKIVIRRIA